MKLKYFLFFLLIFSQSFSLDIEYAFPENKTSIENLRWQNINIFKIEIENKKKNHFLIFRFKLPETNLSEKAIYYYSTEQFYEVYIDNLNPENKILKFHYGTLSPQKLSLTTGENFRIIKLKNDYTNRYIYFKVFYANGDVFLRHRKIEIKNISEIYENIFKENILGMIFSITILVSAIFIITISLSKYFETASFLGAGIFILFIGLKQLSENLLSLYIIDFPFLWGYIAFFSSFLMMPGIFIFLDIILKKKFYLQLKTLLYTQIFIILVISFIVIFSKIALSVILNFYFIYLLGVIIILFSFLLFSSLENNREAQFLSRGGFFLLITAIYEILSRGYGIFRWLKNTLDIGIIFFIYSIMFILFYRFIKTYREKEEYLKELTIKNNQFLLIKEQLENILSQKNLELETAINRIKLNRNIIEKELELAKKIQYFLIPNKPSLYNIATFYQPMEQVCGDFYDFIDFENEKIGIFISDVAGHGVPAALITSMLKSAINQMQNELTNPSKFLKKLNDFLFLQIQGHFVTAFYGIFDRKSRKLTYANAGHPIPYKISDASIEKIIPKHKGIPLGIMTTEETIKIGKSYINEMVKLNSGDKILLFTDGLLEAIPFNQKNKEKENYFGDKSLEKILDKFKNLSPSEIVNKIHKELLIYRGNEIFDDDICIICLEIS